MYNAYRTNILLGVSVMSAIGYVIVILGAMSVSVNLMHLIDRLERPRRSQRRRNAA